MPIRSTGIFFIKPVTQQPKCTIYNFLMEPIITALGVAFGVTLLFLMVWSDYGPGKSTKQDSETDNQGCVMAGFVFAVIAFIVFALL